MHKTVQNNLQSWEIWKQNKYTEICIRRNHWRTYYVKYLWKKCYEMKKKLDPKVFKIDWCKLSSNIKFDLLFAIKNAFQNVN